MKTLKKTNSRNKLYNKYCKNKKGLSEKDIIKLIRTEYKDNHDKNVIISLMNIWGTNIKGNLFITKKTFTEKLYKEPDGFFREKI